MNDLDWITYGAGVADEFRKQGRRVLGEECRFLVTGARYSDDGIVMLYEVDAGPGKNGGVTLPDRQVLMELLARTYRIRSRRVDMRTRLVPRLPDYWELPVTTHFPIYRGGYLNFERGWADLAMATGDWLQEVDPGYPGLDQAKQKWGGLDLQGPVSDVELTGQILDSAQVLSEYICEQCGEPGCNGAKNGWYATLCEEHRNG